jgi:hypothetical protein
VSFREDPPCASSTRRSNPPAPACSTSATDSRCTGRRAASPTASPSCSCTADPAPGAPRTTGGCSTPRATGSCCSTSAAAAAACRTRATRPRTCRRTRHGPWSRTSSGCGSTCRSTRGRCSAARGARRSPWPTPRRTRTGSPSSSSAGSSRCGRARSTGSTRAAPRTSSPTCGRGTWLPCRRTSGVPADWSARSNACSLTRTPPQYADPTYALAFARIENHYFTHDGWFEDGQLIRDAHRLEGIPTVIVQGRYDLCTPAVTAWDLHRALPSAEFRLIDDAGHAFDEPGILDALLETTDRFAGSAG